MTDRAALVKPNHGLPAVYHGGRIGIARNFTGVDMADRIRSEMVRRIEILDRCADRLEPGDVAAGLETLRRVASAKGMQPAVDVIHVIDSLLARGERGPMIHGLLGVLRDAAVCETGDRAAREAIAAACAVRLGA